MPTTEEIATFCKRKGLVYPTAELYGGLSGFFDYGPLGVELKNNIKAEWWRYHVRRRDDIVGLDGSIITNPKVWKASGHVDHFEDIMVEDAKTNERFRADQILEETLGKPMDGLGADELFALIEKHEVKSPKGNPLVRPSQFNLMFSTQVGPKQDSASLAYLRPETAQLIFADFKLVAENARLKLPFGIAQVGKAFRNEISPRDFIFRCREFEQMEIEYFIKPGQACPYIEEVEGQTLSFLTAKAQQEEGGAVEMTVKQAIAQGVVSDWHAYWLATEHAWFTGLGVDAKHLRVRQHLPDEMSHYAKDTWDLEYNFPFGWKELEGIANRTDFDLKAHQEASGKDLSLYDEESKQRIVPHVVAEPSLGVERSFLVFLFDAYHDDKDRGNIVLRLHPKIAPVQVGVFSLVKKLDDRARAIHRELREHFSCVFDSGGSIGRRYARADEMGIPFCVTIDFEDDGCVTVRDRDSTEQERVKVERLAEHLRERLS